MNDNGIATEQAANDNRRALRLVVLCATGCGQEAVYDDHCDEDIATYVAGPFVDPAIGLRLAIGTTLRRVRRAAKAGAR